MPQLVSVRTNTRFELNYETKLLEPEVELIFIMSKPVYNVDRKKGQIVKDLGVTEVRINTDTAGITKLIGELTALQTSVVSIANMGEAFNTIIKNSQNPKD